MIQAEIYVKIKILVNPFIINKPKLINIHSHGDSLSRLQATLLHVTSLEFNR